MRKVKKLRAIRASRCCAVVLGSLLLMAVCGCGHKAGSEESLPIWQPNPVLADHLATEVNLRSYSIRPPQGFTARHADALETLQPFGIGMYRWSNDPSNPNFSDLSVQIIRNVNFDAAVDVLNYELKLTNKDLKHFVASKPEIGKINGMVFARAYWQGIDEKPSGKYVTRGFSYASASRLQGIYITGSDTIVCGGEPCSYQPIDQLALPVAEASIMTFRKL